ncbi:MULTISPECIES: type I-E CRISPR-associated protein Cse2/CasB [Enorma]|uniref:Type I-E CRISPR-associated protein Cse2/CasB n=1 Tax=[Collinsella] massiliensis TaxID=1232426 RepID=A0A1Y3XWG9_9ACTN|nr:MULTISPECIES: type I-E CRISPR-associated protein Cse2/CasB [Enorma]OUN89451.1 hypothetical protein B5G02_01470 [[Collinsella] massiliensis]
MSSLYERANKVALFVQRKIVNLQRAYVNKGAGAAQARATLARLRRLGMPGGASWISVGEDLFEGICDLGLSGVDEARALGAIAASLRLYAYHQQSRTVPMAMTEAPGASRKRRRSFGWSCRRIEYDREKAKGVRRRMAAIESARDLDGIEHHMRALIMLMRDKAVQVDYFLLACDLYLLQIPSARSDVFMRWSKDYFTAEPDDAPADSMAGTSENNQN